MDNHNKPLITIVIPIYNVEKYLEQCLDSVINQTYDNLEIVCVNDCSPDNCAKILEKYSSKDKRIKIINNTKNLGLGRSRNEGIKVATGEYIHCLDSDDWVELYAYEKLVKILNSIGNVDIIRFCYKNYYNKHHVVSYGSLPDIINHKVVDIFNYPWAIKYWVPSAWAKLIRTDFIRENNLYYNDYRCLEDIEYSILSIINAKSIYFSDDAILYYRSERKGSLLRSKNKFIKNVIQDTKTTIEITKNFPQNVRESILCYIYRHLIGLSLDAYYCNTLTFNELRKIYKDYIIYEVLENEKFFDSMYNAKIYKKIMSYNSFHFRISYCGRKFVKKHFKLLTSIYFYIKRKLFDDET